MSTDDIFLFLQVSVLGVVIWAASANGQEGDGEDEEPLTSTGGNNETCPAPQNTGGPDDVQKNTTSRHTTSFSHSSNLDYGCYQFTPAISDHSSSLGVFCSNKNDYNMSGERDVAEFHSQDMGQRMKSPEAAWDPVFVKSQNLGQKHKHKSVWKVAQMNLQNRDRKQEPIVFYTWEASVATQSNCLYDPRAK